MYKILAVQEKKRNLTNLIKQLSNCKFFNNHNHNAISAFGLKMAQDNQNLKLYSTIWNKGWWVKGLCVKLHSS